MNNISFAWTTPALNLGGSLGSANAVAVGANELAFLDLGKRLLPESGARKERRDARALLSIDVVKLECRDMRNHATIKTLAPEQLYQNLFALQAAFIDSRSYLFRAAGITLSPDSIDSFTIPGLPGVPRCPVSRSVMVHPSLSGDSHLTGMVSAPLRVLFSNSIRVLLPPRAVQFLHAVRVTLAVKPLALSVFGSLLFQIDQHGISFQPPILYHGRTE